MSVKEEKQHFHSAVESASIKEIKVENNNENNPQHSELGTSNCKDSQNSDSETTMCKATVNSNSVQEDHKKDETDSQCKNTKKKTDHFAEYGCLYIYGVIVRDGRVVDTRPNPTLVAKNAQIKQQPTSYSREGIVETDFNVWNKKLAYLPKFDGTNWQAFISVLEHNISRHNLTNSLQLDLLESKLSGQAFQAYGQAHTSMDTYAELKKFLQLRFGTRITPQNCRDDLCHIKQCTDESLVELS